MTDLKDFRQHELLVRLLHISRDQGRALRDERLDWFLSMMSEREEIISDLEANARGHVPPNVVAFPTMTRPGAEADITAAMSGLLASVLTQDEENERTLRGQMDNLLGSLAHINLGYTTARGYANALLPARAGTGLNVAN
jgi:hypothetical protein